jgi:hypothetical protein
MLSCTQPDQIIILAENHCAATRFDLAKRIRLFMVFLLLEGENTYMRPTSSFAQQDH